MGLTGMIQVYIPDPLRNLSSSPDSDLRKSVASDQPPRPQERPRPGTQEPMIIHLCVGQPPYCKSWFGYPRGRKEQASFPTSVGEKRKRTRKTKGKIEGENPHHHRLQRRRIQIKDEGFRGIREDKFDFEPPSCKLITK